jgi:Ca-activated chloride channel family protein
MDGGIALRTTNPADRVALRGVRVHARLAGMSQRTAVEQTFVNLEPRAVEAVYTFPLPEGAAVCGFEVVTGDRVLTGAVEESDRAIERYDDAVADGHGAFLAEQERPDVFTVRVGNLKPRQAATIRLAYVCPLDRTDKQVRVAFPTTVAPRYATATATDPFEATVDGDALNPPHALWVPYGLSIRVDVELGRKLAGVFSPSHPVRVDRLAEDRAVVTLAGGVTEMNRDVVLTIELPREHEPSVQLERGGPDGRDYLAVTFVPEFDVDELAEPAPADVVFVLDCSGSMAGPSIAQAKAALELCLRSLSPGDTFNVCRFGSSFELMASEPLAYSQATLDRALAYVRASGDLGGTELHAPLQAIFKVRPRPGGVRQVILLTDGQVTNEPAVVELARRHRAYNRLFTFGIGPACSAFLVKGLARATGGAAEFITAGERIDEKVLRTFGRLASPIAGDVAVDWDGCDVQTLAEHPPVFDGDVLVIFGRVEGRVPRQVTLGCATPAGPKRWTVPVGAAGDFGGAVATMWARRTIQSLEEVNAVAPRARKADRSREREMLVKLSKDFGLLCSVTTFVAIEHRSLAERNEGRPAFRRVPVQLAEGWGGGMGSPAQAAAAGMMFGAMVARAAPAAPAAPSGPPFAVPRRDVSLDRTIDKTMDQTIDRMRSRKPRRKSDSIDLEVLDELAAGAPHDRPSPLQAILSEQTADGWFEWDHALVGTGDNRLRLEHAVAAWLGGLPDLKVLATLAALVRLRAAHRAEEAVWRRADRKAVRWLATAIARPAAEIGAWLQQQAADPAFATTAAAR